MGRLRSHLTYANVMATVAVFVALGGTSYAAIKVSGKNVKNGSLTGADLKTNSVTGKDVKSLGAGDFKKGTLRTGATGKTGATGPAGAPGSALAFGKVSKTGVLSQGKNATVRLSGTSTYCIDVLSGTPQNISGTFTGGSTIGSYMIADVSSDSPACDRPGEDATVTIFAGANFPPSPQPFYFAIN